MTYEPIVIPVATTGSAGAAVGSAESPPLTGEVLAVHVHYHPTAPATTTVDVDEVDGPARKVLDKAASNTTVTHYPRAQMQDITGTPVAGIYEPIPLAGRKLRVSVANSNPLPEAVVVTIIIQR
ncbi:MAG: hypothetical protein K8L97_09805 [Anaerolineae bacterium]|nr:hypothetical protein [Anaerolineae bacterium]